MDKIIKKVDNDGYGTEYIDYRDIFYKLHELEEEYNKRDKVFEQAKELYWMKGENNEPN